MANIKLKNNYWVTESIYDTTDSKTQKQVNADLHQDVSDLKSAFSLNSSVNLVLEQGNISSSTGDDVESTSRLRTADFYYCKYGFSVVVPDGFRIYIYYYSDSIYTTLIGRSDGWLTGTYTNNSPMSNYARFVVSNASNTDLAPSDVTTAIVFSAVLYTDTTLTIPNKAADAKKTGDEISELKSAINNFRPNQLKRKWIFIGDSYGHASGSNNGWIDKLVPMLGLSSSDYYESSAGGYSFAGSYTFLSLLTTLTGNITDKTAITDIVVLGGANDIGVSASAIETAIESFNSYAYTNYPNATVRIGMIAACSDASRVAPQYSRAKEGYSNCGKAQYLNNLEFVFQNRDLIGNDNIHPTSTGYDILTKKIFEALNGGCNVVYREFGTPTYPTGFNAITGASTYNVIVNNEITTITIPQRTGKIAADSSSYFAVQAGTPVAVCNLPTKLILTGAIDQHAVLAATTIATVMSKVNESFFQIKGSLFIAGNDRTVYFIPQDIILGTTSAFNSCDRISIDAVAFTAPSIMV